MTSVGRHSSATYFTHFTKGRGLRTSPLYTRLKQAGAVFEQIMGFERPIWYDIRSTESKCLGLTYISSDLVICMRNARVCLVCC